MEGITPVILCGGSGRRLWPVSRAARPKPFLPLVGDQTLFDEAIQRCRYAGFGKPIIVTGAAHEDLVHAHLAEGDVAELILEPQPRQTAAAVALAALRSAPSTVMLVCPSDHHIGDWRAFSDACLTAGGLAAEGWLVCIAIPPASPETRFGYVRRGEAIGPRAFRVAQFVEKPDRATAEAYVSSGKFAWNCGIFAFRAGDYLTEIEKHRPAMYARLREAAAEGKRIGNKFQPEATGFSRIVPESLDYAVMENTDRAAMVMANMDWSDVGDWHALHAMRQKDAEGNTIRGEAELIGCRNVLVDTDGPKVHAIGLEDLIVVVDGNDVLVVSASETSRVAELSRSAGG